jgi:hypothetical protein
MVRGRIAKYEHKDDHKPGSCHCIHNQGPRARHLITDKVDGEDGHKRSNV